MPPVLAKFSMASMNGHGIAAGRQFVMAALAGQNRPGAAFTHAIERASVGLLAIAVMVVAPPARALRQIAFEHLINHRERIDA